jgi:hypothetical protein
MMGSLGLPELLLLLLPLTFWLAVMGALVWGLLTVNRIRRAQESMAATLKSIEQELQRGRGQ